MINYTKDFVDKVKKYISLASSEGLNAVYDKFSEDEAPILTRLLLDSGVEPLVKLKTIPNSYAYGINSYKYLNIPNNVEKIDKYAFFLSGVSDVRIGSGVVEICKGAFADNENLSSVLFANNSNLRIIGNGAFTNNAKLKEMVLPHTVEYIDKNAFMHCSSLDALYLPKSVMYIGEGAFYGCNLCHIYYNGTVTEFKQIDVRDRYLTAVYCREANHWILYKL